MSRTKSPEAMRKQALENLTAFSDSIMKAITVKEIKRSMQFMGVECDSKQEEQLFDLPADKLAQEAQMAQAAVVLWRENEVAKLMQETIEKQKAQEALPAIKKDHFFN